MGQDPRSQEERDLGHLRGPKPKREEGEGSENWMIRAYQAGASMEEVADVLALSVFLDMPCEQVKNIIVDAQARAKFGARRHVKRFGADLKRLAGDPPGHAEVLVVDTEGDQKIDSRTEFESDPNKLLTKGESETKTEDGEL